MGEHITDHWPDLYTSRAGEQVVAGRLLRRECGAAWLAVARRRGSYPSKQIISPTRGSWALPQHSAVRRPPPRRPAKCRP